MEPMMQDGMPSFTSLLMRMEAHGVENGWSCPDEDGESSHSELPIHEMPAEEVEVGAESEDLDGVVVSVHSEDFNPICSSGVVQESPSFSTPDADQVFEGYNPNHSPDSSTTEVEPDLTPDAKPSPSSWKKRKRMGIMPDFREASLSRKSTIESVFMSFRDRKTEFVVSPEVGLEFDSLQEAFDFYNLYSWEIGFGIRFGNSRINPQKSKISQDIQCACAGRPRHGDSSKSISCCCQALIRLHRTDDHGWYIHEFKKEHNHGLSLTCGEKLCWASHRSIDPHTKALIKNLRDNNVELGKVFSVMGTWFGSMQNVPFTKRSLRNLCAGISRDHSEDDVRKTFALFSELKRSDPNFVDSCLADKCGNIRALMWTNGKSRMQYKHFGDAITCCSLA